MCTNYAIELTVPGTRARYEVSRHQEVVQTVNKLVQVIVILVAAYLFVCLLFVYLILLDLYAQYTVYSILISLS